jgi:hypothetical protein
MQRRRLAVVLLHAVLVLMMVSRFSPAAQSAPLPDDPEPEATATPTAPPAPAGQDAPPADAGQNTAAQPSPVPSGNNIVGLNVARLRRDRYISAAADLVNANGGDWGYLTVVFTATERDGGAGDQLLQELLDRCYENHLQPIIRVATTYDEGSETWSRPAPDEPEKWRAFLERGRWPVRHVWVVAGNEPNLGREWGGEVDSTTYAQYLSHFLDVFADSDRFKVVNGALDASNTSDMPMMQDEYEFLSGMDAAVPGIFGRLAAWASNPYAVPNNGPDLRYTHLAYQAELDAVGRDMPVIITEAGHLNTGDDNEIAAFYEQAFKDWMADPRVIAVTPLFWHPDRGVYWMFDFDKNNKVIDKTPTYDLIMRLPRMRGSPEWEPDFGNTARGEQPSGPKPGPSTAVALAPRPEGDSAAKTTDSGDGAARPAEPGDDAAKTTDSGDGAAASTDSGESAATPTPAPDQPAPTQTPAPATPTPAPPTPTALPPTPTPRTAVMVPSIGATPTPRAGTSSTPTSGGAQATGTPSGTVSRFFRIGNTDGDPVRVRSQPSRSAPAIASVTEGTRVLALGSAERGGDLTWQRVRIANGTEGWIAADFLTPD